MASAATAKVAEPPSSPRAGGVELGPLDRVGLWMSGYPESSAQRFLHHLPIPLWRLGLGPVLGHGFMLLTTKGAQSGRPRTAALSAHHVDGRLYAWCPYGRRASWFRNLEADPLVTVQTAEVTQGARAAHVQDEGEAAELYDLLRRFDARMLNLYLAQERIPDERSSFVGARARLHLVRLDPAAEPGPPGVARDLLWVWPVAAALTLLLVLRRARRT